MSWRSARQAGIKVRRVVISGARKISIKCTKVQAFVEDIIALGSSMVKKILPLQSHDHSWPNQIFSVKDKQRDWQP